MGWTPQGIKIWELELVDFERVRHTMWYRNGQLHETQTYVDGLVDGPFVSYYPSGVKRTEGACSEGDPVGKWIRYNEDGSVSKIEDYTVPTSQPK
jgi:antitoxin component YwqK of YwqJK toxin-antitoxin module